MALAVGTIFSRCSSLDGTRTRKPFRAKDFRPIVSLSLKANISDPPRRRSRVKILYFSQILSFGDIFQPTVNQLVVA